jgi:hypothetical protein
MPEWHSLGPNQVLVGHVACPGLVAGTPPERAAPATRRCAGGRATLTARRLMGLRRCGSLPDETDSAAVYRPGDSDTPRLGAATALLRSRLVVGAVASEAPVLCVENERIRGAAGASSPNLDASGSRLGRPSRIRRLLKKGIPATRGLGWSTSAATLCLRQLNTDHCAAAGRSIIGRRRQARRDVSRPNPGRFHEPVSAAVSSNRSFRIAADSTTRPIVLPRRKVFGFRAPATTRAAAAAALRGLTRTS